MIKNPVFLKLLVSKGILGEEAARRLIGKYEEDAFAVLNHLARINPSQKVALGRLWGDSLGISYIDLKSTLFQRQIVQQLPESFARKNQIILLYQFGDAITCALGNPSDHFVLKEAEKIVSKPLSPVFAFPEEIQAAIEVEYKADDYLKTLSSRIVTDTILIEDITELTRDELQQVAGTQAVVEFVHGLLLLAVREGASDIHIEPGEDKVRIRFRIDGLLQEKSRLETTLLGPVTSRLKILANLDIAERRRPQDGRISLKLPNREVDFRFSCIPTLHGEKVVLRLLGQTQMADIPDLSELFLSKSTLDALKRVLQMPHGIFFVTGPTGSGKTTTLFSMLKHLNHPGINITTIEDPIEYKLPGITQIQVNPAVDLDFASALRSFLRQDPDVILVGEIRDMETAHIACQASLTGHLVLATLHTNNAVQAVTRLIDIGVQPFMVAPSLVGVMSQRLVRKVCDHCKESYTPSAEDISRVFLWEGREIRFYRGKGCSHCNHTGYAGRLAIHEIILVDGEIRKMIAQGAPVSEIQHYSKLSGFQSMRYDGIKKVLRGLTTLEEILRVTPEDEALVRGTGS